MTEKLLTLPDNLGCYALLIFSQDLEWFYSINPLWTEANLLSALSSGDNNDKQAFWSGFLRCEKTPQQNLYMRLKSEMLSFAKCADLDSDFEWNLTAMILNGWGSRLENSNERCVTNDELHDLILHGGDELRIQLIGHLEQWCKKNDVWRNQLADLLRDVWPRQLSVQTPMTSLTLFDLVFSNADIFNQIADIILPLLSPIKHPLLDIDEKILQSYPAKVLALLHQAFTDDNPTDWPYDLEETLDGTAKIDPQLRADSRWLMLKRRLNEK